MTNDFFCSDRKCPKHFFKGRGVFLRNYDTLIDRSSFTINKFLAEELAFLEEEGIIISDFNNKWEWLNEDLAKKYFISVLLPFFIVKPTVSTEELIKLGFRSFIQKLKRANNINYARIKNPIIQMENLEEWYVRLYGKEMVDKKLANAESRLSELEELGGVITPVPIAHRILKLKVFFDLGFYPVKCKECDVDIVFFPSLQIHHPNAKTITMQHLYEKKVTYDEALRRFKADRVELLCNAHHKKKGYFYLINFADLIFRRDLFSLSAEEIDEYITVYLDNFRKSNEYDNIIYEKYILEDKQVPEKLLIKWKNYIKTLIRKRYILLVLFNEECSVCGTSDSSDLELHHKNPKLKNKIVNWSSVGYLDCEEIIRLVMQENCISLCSVCHSFITSKYHISVRKILRGFYSEPEIDAIEREVLSFYNKATDIITHFEYDLDEINFRSPLKLEFSQSDVWKIHFMAIYFYLKIFGVGSFLAKDFLKDTTFNTNTVFRLSKRSNFIKVEKVKNKYQNFPPINLYFITEEGEGEVLSLLHQHPETAFKIKEFIEERRKGINTHYMELYERLNIRGIRQ